jgi:hypothetical protein
VKYLKDILTYLSMFVLLMLTVVLAKQADAFSVFIAASSLTLTSYIAGYFKCRDDNS